MSAVVPAAPFYALLGRTAEEKKIGSQLTQQLNQFKGLISLAIEALKRVVNGDIPDPTVGENACQLRAWAFATFLNSADFEETVKTSFGALERVGKKIELLSLPQKSEDSLCHFLEASDCQLALDERVHQLVSAYLLTFAREPVRSFQKIDQSVQPCEKIKQTDQLKKIFGRAGSDSIEKTAKKYLAFASVQYLQQAAKEDGEAARLLPLVTGKYVLTTQLGLRTAPCFSGAEVFLSHAKKNRVPLVVRIHRVDAETAQEVGSTTFFYVSDGSRYLECNREQANQKRAWIFGDAVSVAHPSLSQEELTNEMRQREISEVVLAFMATHPTYGGDLKQHEGPPEEASRREEYKQKALAWGCCPENQRLCRFYHIYPVGSTHFKEEEK